MVDCGMSDPYQPVYLETPETAALFLESLHGVSELGRLLELEATRRG